MRAVDTNVLARYYLRDDAAQARTATGTIASGAVSLAIFDNRVEVWSAGRWMLK